MRQYQILQTKSTGPWITNHKQRNINKRETVCSYVAWKAHSVHVEAGNTLSATDQTLSPIFSTSVANDSAWWATLLAFSRSSGLTCSAAFFVAFSTALSTTFSVEATVSAAVICFWVVFFGAGFLAVVFFGDEGFFGVPEGVAMRSKKLKNNIYEDTRWKKKIKIK